MNSFNLQNKIDNGDFTQQKSNLFNVGARETNQQPAGI